MRDKEELHRRERREVEMKPKCSECGGHTVLYKITTDTLYCRRCGNKWKRKEVQSGKDKRTKRISEV